jgi:hypothetical protein
MTPIKRSGKSSGGVKGKVGTSNLFGRKATKKSARKVKRTGAGHGSANC